MKNRFTKTELLELDFISNNHIEALEFLDDTISLKELLDSFPIAPFGRILINNCLSGEQMQHFALNIAKYLLPIWQRQVPNDIEIANLIERTEIYLQNRVDNDEMKWAKDRAEDSYRAIANHSNYNTHPSYSAAIYAARAIRHATGAAFCVNYNAKAASADAYYRTPAHYREYGEVNLNYEFWEYSFASNAAATYTICLSNAASKLEPNYKEFVRQWLDENCEGWDL